MTNQPAEAPTIGAHLARQPSITVLGVDYLHLRLDDGSDLYVTEHGREFCAQLLPESHCSDRDWFDQHSVKLNGTSAIYRVSTKPVDGVSKDIVLKWNRMAQEIPGETACSDLGTAEFNSPFEEFALVIELRAELGEAQNGALTQKPLAIYVPRRYVEAERMGRKRYRLAAVQERHEEITLDPNRHYAVIYEWLEGIDAAEASARGIIDEATMRDLTVESRQEMARWGFRVRDSKPHHVIVRPDAEGELARHGQNGIAYGLVDFELLERTQTHEEEVRASKRKSYLFRQAHRFEANEQFPPGLDPTTVMGVEYVYGQVESTAGALWVVGRDPLLFDYFLPEKWRKTPRIRLPVSYEAYYTVTKDNIHLVWQVSRVGRKPELELSDDHGSAAAAHGYNSPFEEVALCMELTRHGVETTYPRAIYVTGHRIDKTEPIVDTSRYQSHETWSTPEGHPILSEHHDYIIIRGHWNGPDDQLAEKDEEVYEGVYASEALSRGLTAQEAYDLVLQATADRLAAIGVEDLAPHGDHLLLSVDRSHQLVVDQDGVPVARMCNFELLRRRRHNTKSVPSTDRR